MIRRATTEDADFINTVLKADYEMVSDDGSPPVDEFTCESILDYCLLLELDGEKAGVILMIPQNYITYEQHTCIAKEHRAKVVALVKEAWQWVFDHTPCCKIVTNVPEFNRAANIITLRVGFKLIGVNAKSFLKNGTMYDQYFYGVDKESICQ